MGKLVFIYNAESDLINSVIDYAHKILNPSTYKCKLCSLTHGNFGERDSWKEFKKSANLSMEFYHKDEWEEQHDSVNSYPIILITENEKQSIFIDTSSINSLKSEKELIDLIKRKINDRV